MTKILDERYKQIVDNELLNIFNTLSTSINTKANSSDVYTKLETDEQIRLKVAEIVASAPEDFDTLKEISDWLNTHAESAAAMNVQIQDNASDIATLQSEIQSQSTTIGTHENKIGVLTNNVSSLSTGLSAAIQNISNAQADIDDNSDDISALKERVSINKTTLGYQRKNLFNWKSATWLNPSGSVTVTKKAESITIKSLNTWASATYKLPELEVGIPYTFSTVISDFAKAEGADTTRIKIRLSYDTGGTKPIEDINISADGAYEVTFTPSSKTAYVIFYPNYSGTVYENTYTASELMLRYASITDGTYESYKLTVGEHIDESDKATVTAKNDIALCNSTLGYQKKNLLNNFYALGSAHSWGNVSWNTNSDRSITVKGTASGSTDYPIGKAYLTEGKYTFTTSSPMKLHLYNGTNTSLIQGWSVNSSQTITITESNNYVLRIFMNSGDTHDTTFYFMLRYADVTDDTYEPYVDDVDTRITENKKDITINQSTLGYQVKNLFDVFSVNWSQPSKTTVSEDGTVTTTITSDPREFKYTNSDAFVTLGAGTYKIIVNTTDFVSGTYAQINAYNKTNNSVFSLAMSSKGIHKTTFTLTERTTVGMVIKAYSQTFTVMICDAGFEDESYVPYTKSTVDERLQILEATQLIDNPTVTLEYDFTTEIGTVVNNPWSYDITHMFVYTEVRVADDAGNYSEDAYMCTNLIRVPDSDTIFVPLPPYLSLGCNQAVVLGYDRDSNIIQIYGTDTVTEEDMKAKNHKIQVKITPLAVPLI